MQAKWLVCIDWNDDGAFSDPDEDVTPDVLGLTLEHFRDLASEYMESARLDLELRNDRHRYSPPNAASPLSGNLVPGRRVWVRAAYPFDSLSGNPGTRLSSRRPDLGASFSWAEHGGVFEIAPSGAGVRTAGFRSGARAATIDFGSPDVSFGCWFTRVGVASHGGLCFRRSAGGYLYVRVTGTAIEVVETRTGSSDTLVASTPHTWDDGAEKFLQVTLHGSDIQVFVDDLAVLEAASQLNASGTSHGLFCEGEADHLWRGFGGWVSLFHGRVDAIQPRPRRGAQYCYVRAFDEMERLGTVTLYTYATAQLPQSTGEILDHILDYAGVDPARRKLDDGSVLVPDTFSPAIWGVKALDEIHRLQDEEDGLVYVDGHGRRPPLAPADDRHRHRRRDRPVLLRPRLGRRRGQRREHGIHADKGLYEPRPAHGLDPCREARVQRLRDQGVPGRGRRLRHPRRPAHAHPQPRLQGQHHARRLRR